MNNDGDPITQIFLGGEDEVGARFIQLPDCKHIFAVKDLDYYMDMPNNGEDNRHVIQLKTCPRCKTVIRRSLRYGNVIKQQLLDIEKVKAKVNGNQVEIETTRRDLGERLENLLASFATEVAQKEWNALMKRVNKISNSLVAAVVTNQVMLMERFLEINRKLKARRLHNKIQSEGLTFQEELEYLKKRAMSETVTERELYDINVECTRINLRFELCLLKLSITKLNLTLMESHGSLLKDVQDELSSGKLIQTQRLDELLEMLSGIRKACPWLSPLTPEERQEIVSAMGFKQGHWFKCPNGHPYTIGECGGAMEKSTCNECGAVIGGAQHRLEDGNQVATEMDGARHPAWSEQANMDNYMMVDEA